MKKILSLLLVATLIFSFAAFVACQETPVEPDVETTAPEGTEGSGTEPEETPLDSAVEYVRQLYKDTTSTSLDYTVATSVQVGGVAYSITWTVDTDKITITVNEDGTATVDLPEKAAEDLAYVLTATVADAAGATKSISFNRVVPKFAVNTWAEYYAAETGTTGLVIEGVVTGIVSKTVGATNNCIFVQDTDELGGYYVYGMTTDPVTLGIEIGMTVRVSGDKDIYNGTHEIKNSTVEILSTEKTPVTPIDLTEAYKAAADTKAAELVDLQGALVTLKGVEITTVGDNGYHNFTLAGKDSYMRISGSTCAISPAEQTAYTALHTASRGCTADITGIVSVYSGKFYLVPVVSTAATLSNVKAVERTPAEKVAYEADALTLATAVHMNSSLDLVLAGGTYTDVTITWASDNACAVVTGDKLVITLQAEAQTVKVTATVTLGENTATKEFTIAVDAKPTVVPAPVDTPVAGTAYKFMLTQLNKGQNLFADGAMNGFYFNTTTDYKEAIDVYLEATEGGYYLYTMVGEDKTYISIEGVSAATSSDGKEHVNIIYSTTVKTVYTWNAEHKTLTTEITGTDSKNGTYYIGTYGEYTTFSASLISKIGTSFPAHLVTMIDAASCTHAYAGDCDTTCNLCDAERTVTVEHTWANACDADCNVCGATRTPADHVYDNACDTDCNVCEAKRTTEHKDEDGNKKCDVCQANLVITLTVVGAPTANTQYLGYIAQANLSSKLYLDGGVDGRYLTMTEDSSKAVTVYAEAAEGGFKFYILVEGNKQYITAYMNESNKTSLKYDAAGTSVFKYNAETFAWEVKLAEKDYYLGTYNNFKTVSLSETSYINADKTRVSQFPLEIITLVCTHAYSADCDVACDECGAARTVEAQHTFANECAEACSACGAERVAPHKWENACDTECECGEKRTTEHVDANNDTVCDVCQASLAVAHTCVDADMNFVCDVDGCGKQVLPAANSILTFEQANALSLALNGVTTTDKYYVVGTILEVYNTAYGNMYLDAGNGAKFTIYGSFNIDGTVKYSEMENKPVAGDTVKIYGVIGSYKGAAQIVNGWIVEHTPAAGGEQPGGGETPNPEQPENPTHTCVDANGDFVCDVEGCDKQVLPAEGTTLTIAQALALGELFKNETGASYAEAWYNVTGTITEISSTKYGTCVITDGTNSISVYGLKDSTGTNRYENLEVKPVVGDTVQLYGQVGAYKNGVQMNNSNIIVHTPHTCDYTEATCVTAPTCKLCGAVNGEPAGHTDENSDNICDVCTLPTSTVQTTISTGINEYGEANGWTMSAGSTSGGQWKEMVLGDVTITVTASDSNSGKWYDGNWRIYQSGNPEITFTAAEGKTIVSVKVTYTSNNNGVLTQGTTQIASGTVVNVNANSITLGVGNTGSATNGQARITAIEVIYQ